LLQFENVGPTYLLHKMRYFVFLLAISLEIEKFTLYTGPKPPSPSLLLNEKPLVALAIVVNWNRGSSKSSFGPLSI